MIRGQNYLNLTFFAVAKAQKGRHARPFRGELFKTSVGERFLQQPKAKEGLYDLHARFVDKLEIKEGWRFSWCRRNQKEVI